MSFVYPAARAAAWTGALDLEGATIKALLVGASSTAGAEPGAGVLDDFTALAESDAAGYSRQTLANVSVAYDADGARMLADDASFGVLTSASELIVGVLLIVDLGGPSADVPLAYLDQVEPASIAFPYAAIGRTLEALWTGGRVLDL